MGKKRCANCDSIILDGQTQCPACGSKDFYDEDEKIKEEEKKKRISKWKNMSKGKKTGIILAIVGVFVFSIIMGILFPAEETNNFQKYVYVNEYGEESYFEIDFANSKYNYSGLDFYIENYLIYCDNHTKKTITDKKLTYDFSTYKNEAIYSLSGTGKSGNVWIGFSEDKSCLMFFYLPGTTSYCRFVLEN